MVKLEKQSVKISVVKVFGLGSCELGSIDTFFVGTYTWTNCEIKWFWVKFEIKIKIKIVKNIFKHKVKIFG
jgi:hypothetical protein